MKPPLEQNYYELLEVPRDATVTELDRAYDRARAFYGVGSIAVYSLTTPEELKRVQDRIDEAYLILGDDSARLEYDARIGPPSPDERPLHREVRQAREKEAAKEADAKARAELEAKHKADAEAKAKADAERKAIDAIAEANPAEDAPASAAVAPVEERAPEASPEVEAKPAVEAPVESRHFTPVSTPRVPTPPTTVKIPTPVPVAAEDSPPPEPAPLAPAAEVRLDLTARPEEKRESRQDSGPQPPPPMEAPEPAPRSSQPLKRDSKPPERALPKVTEIPADAIFNGEFLRKLRETQSLSVQELSDRTKIGKSHLENIEADRYPSLPPLVYLRGFLMSYARELKLDPLRVSKSYLEQQTKAAERAKG